MKRIFACAAALGLLVCVPAAAQNDDQHGDKHDAADSHPDRGSPPAGATNGQGHAPSGAAQPKTVVTHQNMNNGNAAGPSHTRSAGTHTSAPAADKTPTNRLLPTTGDVRSSPQGGAAAPHSDIASLRRNIQAPQHFRNGNYRAPQGYQQRHWGYGERLPRGYFVHDYWLTDFSMFGLFAPPAGLVWVRVGDDALLIDRYSGDIVQVRYGVFY